MFTLQTTSNRASRTIAGTVDSRVKIFFGVLDDDIRQVGQHHLNMAAFILTTARAINVIQTYPYALDMIVSGTQGKSESPFYVATQGIRQ